MRPNDGRCSAIVQGRRCRLSVVRDGFCHTHHPAARARRYLRSEESRCREANESRAYLLGMAVMERFTDAERAALPEWFRRDYGFTDAGVPIHTHNCTCAGCETYRVMLDTEMGPFPSPSGI